MNSKTWHIRNYLILLIIVIAVHYSLRKRHALAYKILTDAATTNKAVAILRAWSELPYITNNSQEACSLFIKHTITNLSSLTSHQLKSLENQLTKTLYYLQNPSYHAYFNLKTEGLTYTFAPHPMLLPMLNATITNELNWQTNHYAIASNLWHFTRPNGGVRSVIAFSTNFIAAAISTNFSISAFMQEPVGKKTLVLQTALDAGFTYSSINSVITNTHLPTSALFSVFVKISPTGSTGPLFLSFYWSALDNNWIPLLLSSDASLGLTTVF